MWQSDSIGSGSVAVSKYTDAIVQDGVAWGSYSSVAHEAGTQGYVPEGVTLSGEEKNSATLKQLEVKHQLD